MSATAPTPADDDFPAGQTDVMRDVLLSQPSDAKAASPPAKRWVPPTPDELQKLLPQYEITALLGRGGMGAVFRGTQIALDRPVAIKILSDILDEVDASFAERFKNEAKAMAKLSHPGIVGVFDFGETADGLHYIVMEFVDGIDVARMIARQGRLHTEHAMAIIAHVCDALAYAHDRGIIHRDIKPANIMVGYDGVVKVADFGLAKMTHSQNAGLTQSGMAMGTLHYMAPEVLLLGSAVDHRADIYAVGVMLYQMLTGKIPQGLFELPSLQIKGLDPRLDSIIGKALRDDRDLRYPSVNDMRHDLDAILTQPVVKVEATIEKAPPAVQTKARPQSRSSDAYGRRQYRQASRSSPNKTLATWMAIVATLAGLGWLGSKQLTPGARLTPPIVGNTNQKTYENSDSPTSPAGSFASTTNPAEATKDRPFVNSLGMRFVPVPGTNVLFCVHETRFRDYAAYADRSTPPDAYWRRQTHDGLGLQDDGKNHPVVNVSLVESTAFCDWLSQKEGQTYRLPTDAEWSAAAGIVEYEQRVEGSFPFEAAMKQLDFLWGSAWPPPLGSGNYSDESRRRAGRGAYHIPSYDDGYATTAPVMSFSPNNLGIYDLGGNVWEWCKDKFQSSGEEHGLRGGSWHDGQKGAVRVSRRTLYLPDQRNTGNGFRCVLERKDLSSTSSTKGTTAESSFAAPLDVPTTKTSPSSINQNAEKKAEFNLQPLATGPTVWTDIKGRSLTATFKGMADGNVLLDIAGKVTPVPLATLSPESQKLARTYQEQ